VIIKPENPLWNPVRGAIASVFGQSFKNRADPLERDARDAVQSERYSAQAVPPHGDDIVIGWGWDARRLRTRHIQDELDR
jgi:hypothetical protein